MKKSILILLSSFLITGLFAQEKKEEEKKFGIKLSGFVRNDVVFNTRETVSARGENQFYLAPQPVVLDENGKDINANSNFNIIGFVSRVSGAISGPDAFGAKTSGLIQGDFLGTTPDTKFNFRLRHAMVKFDWESTQLLTGQYWHPTFVTGCFPATVSFGAGVPFNPLSRPPQLRLTKKVNNLSLMFAIMGQGHFKSKNAPALSHIRSGIPEIHAQVSYETKNKDAGTGFLIGSGFGYQILKPGLSTTVTDTITGDRTYITDETVNSMTIFGYSKLTLSPVTIKVYGMFGQNNDNAVMQGGYAQILDNTSTEYLNQGRIKYTVFNVFSGWLDMHTNSKKIQTGLFIGYSENQGTDDIIVDGTQTGRWLNVDAMMRIAPRIVFISGKAKIGVEPEYSSAKYVKDFDNGSSGYNYYGRVINSETADNFKLLVSFAYSF